MAAKNNVSLPNLATPMVDKNGNMSKAWQIFFRDTYRRTAFKGDNAIDNNTTNIEQNADDIDTNKDNIKQNTLDINVNSTNIATNAGNIANNSTNIADNAEDISINASNIADNTESIDNNLSNIEAVQSSSLILGMIDEAKRKIADLEQLVNSIPPPAVFSKSLITGPASSTDNAVTRFDGLTGTKLQNSSVLIDDSGNITLDNAAGPAISNETPTANNPTLSPNKADLDTGIGWASADLFNLIAGSIDLVSIDGSGAASTNQVIFGKGATLRGSAATPLIALGDGDTGFYEVNDDDLAVSLGGTPYYQFLTTELQVISGSIKFPSTQIPNSDPNALDDYEEGTWTPIITFAGSDTTAVYSIQAGFYEKIGRIVNYRCFVVTTTKSTSTGQARIEGLPFTSASTANSYSTPNLRYTNVSFADSPQGFILTSTSAVILEEISNAGVKTNLDDTNFASNSGVMLTGSYMV